MNDAEKQHLAGDIVRALSGEAERETGYKGPLTAPAPNATQVQRDSYTAALMQRNANDWTAAERAYIAGEITKSLRESGL